MVPGNVVILRAVSTCTTGLIVLFDPYDCTSTDQVIEVTSIPLTADLCE